MEGKLPSIPKDCFAKHQSSADQSPLCQTDLNQLCLDRGYMTVLAHIAVNLGFLR